MRCFIMKSKYLFGLFLIVGILVVGGCAQQQTKYVCPDGTTVSDVSYCPKQVPKSVETKPSGPYCGDDICNGNERVPDCADCKMNMRIENLKYEILKPVGQFKEFYITSYDVIQLEDKAAVYPSFDLYTGYSQQQCSNKGMMSKLMEDFFDKSAYFIVDSDKRGMSYTYLGEYKNGFQIETPEYQNPICIYFIFYLKPYSESSGIVSKHVARYESGIIQV